MFQTLSKKLRNRKGFTLIELIVVLAILGIILAIAVPNYLGVQDSAAESADNATLELVEKGIALWSASTAGDQSGNYTLAFGATDLQDIVTATNKPDVSSFLEGVSAPTSAHYNVTGSVAAKLFIQVTATGVTANFSSGDTLATVIAK